jgi:cellulose synthase/poly-beta-1,6-N-acetylglucosamine synthase-like glycosyltransferase
MDLTSGLIAVFWACAALVAYAYAGYPVVIWALSRAFGRRPDRPDVADDRLPTVSMVLAAYNEEAVIEERLRNALATDYPPGKLEILVGSDGSTDRTAEIVGRFADRGVRLLDFAENRGKATVLNATIAEATGAVLVLSDANTHVEPDAVRRLVGWFGDPRVGAAVGRLVLVDPRTGRNADGLYWRYETFLKRREAWLGALLGANGAIYAIRRDLYEPIPPATIVDDFVIPLLARLRSGCAIAYDPSAVAVEETPADVGAEFHRRARIGAGGFQAIGMLWRLLDPRRGWVAFAFLSHKVLRWLGPFFLIGALASNLLLAGRPFYRACLAGQVAFYGLSLLVASAPAGLRIPRTLRLTTMFTGMNAALLVGFWRWLAGRQKAAWRRTARAGAAGGVAR